MKNFSWVLQQVFPKIQTRCSKFFRPIFAQKKLDIAVFHTQIVKVLWYLIYTSSKRKHNNIFDSKLIQINQAWDQDAPEFFFCAFDIGFLVDIIKRRISRI